MNKYLRPITGLSVLLVAFSPVSVASANSIFQDNFDSYTSGSTLTGQGNWQGSPGFDVINSGCITGNCIQGSYVKMSWQSTGQSQGLRSGSYSLWVKYSGTPNINYWFGIGITSGVNGSEYRTYTPIVYLISATNSGWAVGNPYMNINTPAQDNIPPYEWHKLTLYWDLQTNNECNYSVSLDNGVIYPISVGAGNPSNCYGQDSTYKSEGANGIMLYDTSYPVANYIDDIGGDSVVPVSGTISSSTTWQAGSVYKISGNLTINSGVTLTLDPGVIVKFDTATSSGITVNGTLDALGQDEHFGFPVYLTSLKDDYIGGDTNSDASSTIPASDDWSGIQINSGGMADFEHTIVRYGGSVGGSNAMLYNNGGILNVSASSTVAYANTYGIRNSSGTTTISGSDLGFNDYGLYVDGGSTSIQATSTIHDNSSYGVYNATASYINAEGNYWGSNSGPYNATYNPTGTGDVVSDYVDFDPWVGKAGTIGPHYIESYFGCPSNTCGSVRNGMILLDASTTAYTAELGAASSTWNTLGKVLVAAATSTPANIDVVDENLSDLPIKGQWIPNPSQPDSLMLNSYFLAGQTFNDRLNTITHELGHALGLDHSYTGNIMYQNQSSQTSLGSQDISDYNYLWP